MQRSDSIGALAAALAKAQASIKAAAKDAENPHFRSKYADLASVVDACRAQLAANGLAVAQGVEADDARVTVTTMLAHASGEWVESALTLRARDASPQAVGSAITYGRRYGLAALVGVAPDEDDDANSAQPTRETRHQAEPERREPSRPAAAPVNGTSSGSDRVISEPQRKRLYAISKEHGWQDSDLKALLKARGYESGKDIKVRDYDALIEAIKHGVESDEPDHDDLPDYGDDSVSDDRIPF